MKDINEIKNILAKQKGELIQKYRIKEIGIFGSYVKGEEKPKSDIDILVEFNEPVGIFEFMELEEYLSRIVETKVDLVSKKALKPRIGKRILQEVVYL